MRRCLLIGTGLFLAMAAAHAGRDAAVRGVLAWSGDRQTITECTTGRVYWVRVLAANPYFLLSQSVEALAARGATSVIAELRGTVEAGTPSAGPGYPVDGTLVVREIRSVEAGGCDAAAHRRPGIPHPLARDDAAAQTTRSSHVRRQQ